VRLQSVVSGLMKFAGDRGSVEVRGERLGTQFRYRAPKAIVTLPLGRRACSRRAVRFHPRSAGKATGR